MELPCYTQSLPIALIGQHGRHRYAMDLRSTHSPSDWTDNTRVLQISKGKIALLFLGLTLHVPQNRAKLTSQTPASVRARRKSRKSASAIPTGSEDSEDEDDFDAEAELDETLTWADTLIFPIVGSVALLSFYGVLKYFGKDWINLILGVYCEFSPSEEAVSNVG